MGGEFSLVPWSFNFFDSEERQLKGTNRTHQGDVNLVKAGYAAWRYRANMLISAGLLDWGSVRIKEDLTLNTYPSGATWRRRKTTKLLELLPPARRSHRRKP